MQGRPPEHERLGRYELVSVIGRGGSGVVYEAVMHGLAGFRKKVALKLLPRDSGADDPDARAALQREARLGALLSHPNVVSILDLGRIGEQWFIAMELVTGASVAALLRVGALAPAAILEIGIQTCAGLTHIHELRVDGAPGALVHRDVKPQNLLVDENGLVKIADFGIAALQGTGEVMGTPAWMAPEQLDGRAEPRSDLFSLGAVLYALAALRPPFGSGRQAIAQVRRCGELLRDPSFLAPVDRAVPGLGEIVGRCLRRDPVERWPDAGALAAALRALRARYAESPRLAERVEQARAGGDPSRLQPPREPTDAGTPHDPTADTVVLTPRPVLDLPVVDAAFVGRRAEHDEIASWLAGAHRLVTVLGPGGVGKSRLALAVGATVGRRLTGGALLIGLGEALSADGVCGAVAARLGLPPGPSDPVDQIGHALRNRGPVLVVLDDAERAVEPLARLLARWLELAPEARFVVTSRLPLRMRTERVLTLGPLDDADAVALFRARQVRPTSGDDAVVAELVRALDGLPLAIELAAARSRVMSPQTILERLGDRFRLLAGETVDARHATLRASIDASWELLQPWERAAMGQLAVFADGIALEDAEAALDLAAWPEAPWAIDVLSGLVDCSLLRFEAATERFRMMMSVQEYALATLDPAQRRAAEIRHGEAFARLGQPDTIEALHLHDGERHRRRLHAERENLVFACRRAVARGDPRVASATAIAIGALFRDTGPLAAGEAIVSEVLAMADVPRKAALLVTRGQLRSGIGRRELAAGDFAEARALAEAEGDVRVALGARALLTRVRGSDPEAAEELREVAALARAHGEVRAEARALSMRGLILREQRALADAREVLEQALVLFRRIGDAQGEALVHLRIGLIDRHEGRTGSALRRFEEAVRLFRAVGDRHNAAAALGNVATCYADMGRYGDARAALEAVIAHDREIGHLEGEAGSLANLAVLDRWEGRIDEARARNEAALRLARECGNRVEEARVVGNLALLSDMLGDLATARAQTLEARELYRRVGRGHDVDRLAHALARLALAEGDPEEALRILDGVQSLGVGVEAADHTAQRVLLLARVGRLDEARAALARLEAMALDTAEYRYTVRIARARVALAAGDPVAALAELDQVDVEIRERTELWLLRAEALHLAGDPAKRDRALAAAASAIERSGARPGSTVGRELARLRRAFGVDGRKRRG